MSPRDVMNGILWVMRTGAPWARFARALSPVPRRVIGAFNCGAKSGALKRVLHALANDLAAARRLRSDRSLHRRHLRGGEKRGGCVGNTRKGKGTKIMAIADGRGLPLAIGIESASPGEVTLVEATLAQRFLNAPAAPG